MVVVTNQIEQARACYTPTNDDYIGCTFEDFYMAKSPFTLVQKFIILMTSVMINWDPGIDGGRVATLMCLAQTPLLKP